MISVDSVCGTIVCIEWPPSEAALPSQLVPRETTQCSVTLQLF
jgi:hypothetical protein